MKDTQMTQLKRLWKCLKNWIASTKKWLKRALLLLAWAWVLTPGSSLWGIWALHSVSIIPASVTASISLAVLRVNQRAMEFNLWLANPQLRHLPEDIDSSNSTKLPSKEKPSPK